MSGKPKHLGAFIKEKVFPSSLTVTAAAEILNIGRVALSRVLNGKASLSPDLAERIETAFGFPAAELLQMQASYQNEEAKHKNISVPVGLYVPPFLQITANQVESWASEHEARSRLPVLLRILVNSTGSGLTKVDFPGNDDSQRKGWDGFVEADRARPWIPEGASGWEFGCSEDVKRKANSDFGKRTGTVSAEERKDIAFVFATPRLWAGKNDWEKERRAEDQWKDVRVFDASDLEQWMEQSIPAQAWFAYETGIPSEGILSLEGCWNEWEADCEPVLVSALFDQAVKECKKKECRERISRWFDGELGRPLVISADSSVEALAFLHVLFSGNEFFPQGTGDKVVVFRKSGVVPEIVTHGSDMIAVSTSREIECELASQGSSVRTILVYPRKIPYATKPDIDLKPLNPFNFASALGEMGCAHDEVNQLSRESGFSLTVLRRRLSKHPAVQTPVWASDEKHANSLLPMLFAGAWDERISADRLLVSFLARSRPYEDVELDVRSLIALEDSPLWSVGTYRGVKSKIDLLFAVSCFVTESQIKRFFEVVEIVLSEDDPALDLPDEMQWAAVLYGKSRNISDMMRKSMTDSFILLAVYGNELFLDRIGFDIEERIANMVKKLLCPLTQRSLEAQRDALMAYAETAPEEFLSIIEEDLEKEELGKGKSEILGMLRPMNALIFKTPPRSELLWAIESLAWSETYLSRTVDILARLSRVEINDNWLNKPINSLASVFWFLAPQTSVPVDERIEVFNRFLEKFRDIGWMLCVKQFTTKSMTGWFNQKPKWRTDGHGYGHPAPIKERLEFFLNAVEKAVNWPCHTKETLSDLIENFDGIPSARRPEIWKLIEDWNDKNPSDEDRAWLREKIRVSVHFDGEESESADLARAAYEMLGSSDLVVAHEWLFQSYDVVPSREELKTSGFDFLEHEEKIKRRRVSALSEIYSKLGIGGLIRLSENAKEQNIIGRLLTEVDSFSDESAKTLIRDALHKAGKENLNKMENLVSGVIEGFGSVRSIDILKGLLLESETSSRETFLRVLLLLPFGRQTWKFVDELAGSEKSRYWAEFRQLWAIRDPEELNEAAERLMKAGYPAKALELVRYQFDEIETGRIFRLLEAVAKDIDEGQDIHVESSWIIKAFNQLDKRGEVQNERMAGLEEAFVDYLDKSDRGVPGLENQISKHPELFVKIVAQAFTRDDPKAQGRETVPPEKQIKALKLLDALRRLPARSESGKIDPKKLVKWVRNAQVEFERCGRRKIGDDRIGNLLAISSEEGGDGVWPSEAVRDVLEEVYNREIADGFDTGRFNSKGMNFRWGNTGDPEREEQAKYVEWSKKIRYSHPKVSRILQDIADSYSRTAEFFDIDDEKRNRLSLLK